jgi:putative transport protein
MSAAADRRPPARSFRVADETALLLGALTGSQTVTAAMAAVQERSGSPVAVLGYTPAYPVANILLTTWGTIVVLVVAG